LSRGASKLNVKDLCALVEKYMHQVGGPPPIKQDIGVNVENIEHMLKKMSMMMTACMQNECYQRSIHLLDLKIKVFLSDFARFDDGMKSRNDAVDVISTINRPPYDDSSDDDEATIIDAMDNYMKKEDEEE
jgi:hypothetical protein